MSAAAGHVAFGIERSLSGRRWVWREGCPRLGLGLAQRLGVPEIVGRVLAARGVNAEAAADFLAPRLRRLLPDPSCLIDMDRAAARLAAAVEAGETVAVFGDYDVDGACSAALMTGFLRDLGCRVLPYVPDRLREGYGPNAAALAVLVSAGASLILCLDCGTTAMKVLRGVPECAEVVVLDHHQGGVPPAEIVLVNPNRPEDRSGLSGLCAAAVAFMTVIALTRLLRRRGFFTGREEPDLLKLLDLVALATVCDAMPLIGLNRALVSQGLKVMARRERAGLAALIDAAQLRDAPDVFACGFALGPRINAAGRIAEADLGLRLLLCEERTEAAALAQRLNQLNRERQQIEAGILDRAVDIARAQAEAGLPVLLASGAEWHPGVLGIVAGRIKERFNRPACVAGVAAGRAVGSGRSVPGLDLGAAVMAARQAGLLGSGGGHALAAGFSLAAEDLPRFHAFLNQRLAAAVERPVVPELAIEGALGIPGATPELALALARLGPFGAGNEEPVLALARARVVRADRVGREGGTVRVFLEGEGGGKRLKALLYRAQESRLAETMLARSGEPLYLAGHLRAERWNGRDSIGFVIADAAAA